MKEQARKFSEETVCPSKSQKANEAEARFHSASSELQLPPCCLKTCCPGFAEPSVLEEKTQEGKGSHPVPIPHTGSLIQLLFLVLSASSLDQATITFCLAINNNSNQSPVSPLAVLPSTYVYTTAREIFEKVNQIM